MRQDSRVLPELEIAFYLLGDIPEADNLELLFGVKPSVSRTRGEPRIRRSTGPRHVWLRATGSTAISQLIDSFVVLYIAFVIGPQHWSMGLFLAVGTLNYIYKMGAAVALIPLLYLARGAIHSYLGHSQAERMMEAAARA